ncbi:DUF3822 family protein [Mangrovivirga cuniculi]|uniref:DUF3822 domain-containing protein n=1 Tax=Mangrovivirga cuniculi TaxID=2715131 RepID=A0A4D7JTY5_9BACT|nr:DUF3822 family protein [Mangrovivirga cuniculi]QCK16082.1 hypothetical protein DCC35_15700 [Mangrovivirga cuniculi]
MAYKSVRKIKDTRFNIEHLEDYALSLLIGRSDFRMFVTNTRDNSCLIIEEFEYPTVDNSTELMQVLDKIFDEHHLLKAGFWKVVKVAIKDCPFSHVPNDLFEKENAIDHLSMNGNVDQEDVVLYYKHLQSDIVTVFSVNEDLSEYLKGVYTTIPVHFVHPSAAFIENIYKYDDKTDETTVFLNKSKEGISIAVYENSKIVFYNEFVTNTAEAVLKYTMYVFNLLGLNQQSTRVVIWGDTDTQHEDFKLLYQYIRNISFGRRPQYLKCGFVFDVAEDHQYFDLMSIQACA